MKGESEENIAEYLKNQGVIAVKRFTIKKGHSYIETNTLLLTFNMITVPKNLRIFYRFVPVDVYGSLSKNGGIQKGKIIKKYCPKFHFFSNIFINTNMEKIYGKYVQFKNMYNVSIVNYMDGTLA